jgi:NAD+ synthase
MRYEYDENKVFTVEEEIQNIVDWIKKYFVENGPNSKAIIGISGGKDSTIAAALCVKALGADRVIGILMPQGVQSDIDDARKVCEVLGIRSYEIDIASSCNALYRAIDEGYDMDHCVEQQNRTVATNTPARIRMATLYAVAALYHGRVCNTGNRSELYIGYTTKYGDLAGDFALLKNYTVREVLAIGDQLTELPADLIHKAPADGMSGLTDEDNLGFTYAQVDALILNGVRPDIDTYTKIIAAHDRNTHKNIIRLPAPEKSEYMRPLGERNWI